MKDPEWSCPIGDNRLWLKNRAEGLGIVYQGPEPEPRSPKDRQEEERNLRDVLFGKRFPRTMFERQFLRYMGGIQDELPTKWVACKKCKTEFQAAGFPAPNDALPSYPDICSRCTDQEDAGLGHSQRAKPTVRSVYND